MLVALGIIYWFVNIETSQPDVIVEQSPVRVWPWYSPYNYWGDWINHKGQSHMGHIGNGSLHVGHMRDHVGHSGK